MDFTLIIRLTLLTLAIGLSGVVFLSHSHKQLIAISTVIANAILTTILAILALSGDTQVGILSLPHFFGDIIVRIDSLSAWFIIIINFTCINGVLYGSGYLKSYSHLKTNREVHWFCYILLHAALLMVCMLDHGMAFLFAWELMSLSALVLLMFEFQNKTTVRAGINYMIQMHLCVIFLILGFILLYIQTGSFSFSTITELPASSSSTWVFVLLFTGFAIKGGFIPFHTWLPEAHPAAPSHMSGVMSGVIVKMGIYGIFRIIMYLRHDYFVIGECILCLSVLTSIYGISQAAVNHDFKRMLAYCTIENIGIIGIGIGLGLMGIGINNNLLTLLGFSGALLHTLNHSLFKSLLFFSSGSVYQQTHSRNMEHLGGLIKHMPKTATCFLIGALAIGGLPPFNGFVSEFLIYSGLFNGLSSSLDNVHVVLLIIAISSLAIVGGLSVLTFTKTFGVIFLGKPRKELHHKPVETPFIMLLPQYLSIAAMLSIGVFPQFYFQITSNIITSLFPVGEIQVFSLIETIATVGKISLLFIGLSIGIWGIGWLIVRKRPIEEQETWGCAYTTPIVKAQYTGTSFARSFSDLFKLFIKNQKDYEKIQKTTLYPKARVFTTYYFDIIEKYIVTPIARWSTFVLKYFQFIQNGQMQLYLIYGLFFILLVFLGTVFNIII